MLFLKVPVLNATNMAEDGTLYVEYIVFWSSQLQLEIIMWTLKKYLEAGMLGHKHVIWTWITHSNVSVSVKHELLNPRSRWLGWTRDIAFFIPSILPCSQNLVPTLPTMQLQCKPLSDSTVKQFIRFHAASYGATEGLFFHICWTVPKTDKHTLKEHSVVLVKKR